MQLNNSSTGRRLELSDIDNEGEVFIAATVDTTDLYETVHFVVNKAKATMIVRHLVEQFDINPEGIIEKVDTETVTCKSAIFFECGHCNYGQYVPNTLLFDPAGRLMDTIACLECNKDNVVTAGEDYDE